jgi:uroporphyrinogen-III synthase
MRLLVTRPEPDASRQADTLKALGHDPIIEPLLKIKIDDNMPLDLEGAQAVIVTSRNALRALANHPQRDQALKLPLYAVGDATARAASELGFSDVIAGPGTGAKLVELLVAQLDSRQGPLVHLAGDTLAFDVKAAFEAKGFNVRQPVVYSTIPIEDFPEHLVNHIKAGELDGVILMSPRTATIFTTIIQAHDLASAASALRCYCLSDAVAEGVKPLNPHILVASHPREEELLALIAGGAASSR